MDNIYVFLAVSMALATIATVYNLIDLRTSARTSLATSPHVSALRSLVMRQTRLYKLECAHKRYMYMRCAMETLHRVARSPRRRRCVASLCDERTLCGVVFAAAFGWWWCTACGALSKHRARHINIRTLRRPE